MKRADQISGAILLVVFSLVFYQSTKLDMVYRNSPGAGFFPFWLSVGALLATAAVILASLRRPANADRPIQWPRGIGLRRIGLTFVAFLAYATLVTLVGFVASTAAFMIFMARMLGSRRWWRIVFVSVLTAVGLFLIFNVWLQMELPTGRWPIPLL